MAFAVETKTENGFHKIILKDITVQTHAEVIPSCGAILHAFTVLLNGEPINVIDNYTSTDDFTDNVESKGFKSCKLSPFACRIKNASYHFGEQQYNLNKYLTSGNALHGLLYDAVFTVSHQQADDEKAIVSLVHHYHGTEKGYPFYYDCIVTYLLKKDNTLVISTEIVNKDKGLIPLQDGWHPYFTFGGSIDGLQLEFQSKEKILFDKAMIPDGNRITYQEFGSLKKIGDEEFDDCFSVNFAECQPLCVLRDTEKKIQVEIHPGKNYLYLQLYTPPDRRSIAIENLSAIPDAFNNGTGLITLAPQQTATFTTTYKITLLT